mgnify:CR=1 FL=1
MPQHRVAAAVRRVSEPSQATGGRARSSLGVVTGSVLPISSAVQLG